MNIQFSGHQPTVDSWAANSSTGGGAALGKQWHQIQSQVDTFVVQHEDSNKQEHWSSGITKQHWLNAVDRLKCSNQRCCKKFSITERKKHCRKCGDVFCKSCVHYRRKLSARADYDPNGRMHPVCEICFNLEPQKIGQLRTWTLYFVQCREYIQHQEPRVDELERGIRKRWQIKEAMKRLVAGYTTALHQDTVDGKKTFSSLKNKVQGIIAKNQIPAWQKTKTWSTQEHWNSCMACRREFSRQLTNPKHNCRVCGIVSCSECSSRDLLLFVADKCDLEKFGQDPCWAIIKVTGCPEVEPDVSTYQRICNLCKKTLEHLQVEKIQRTEQQEEAIESMTKLLFVHDKIDNVQIKIDCQLPKYKLLVEGLEITTASPRSLPSNRSNMQTLAKAQGDLMDHFTIFVMSVSCLKTFTPSSNIQVKLARNIMKCKFDYYHENMYHFRKLKKQLEDVAPPEVLSGIQDIVDAKTIEVACLSLTQVAYETLYLCMKYTIDEILASTIIQASEMCKADLKVHMIKRGEDWEQCREQMETFIKMQMKGVGIEKRQYLRPSRRLARAYGATYIAKFVTERLEYVTQQIYLQLCSRSIDRKFLESKNALLELRKTLHQAPQIK